MNLLDSNLFITYVNAALIIIFVSIWLLNQTKRHREWLLKSLGLGLFIGPLLILFTKSFSLLNEITLLSGNYSLIEIALLSGLSWSIASSWLISLQFLPPISTNIKVQWLRVVIFAILAMATVFVANAFKIDSSLALISILGLGSIALSVRNSKLLLSAAMTGVIFTILSLAGAYAGGLLYQDVAMGQLTFTTIPLLVQPSYLTLFGMLALSAPIVSQWWYNQPLAQA